MSMGKPVIIDDGGSTRIRLVNAGRCEMGTIMRRRDDSNPDIGSGKKWYKQELSSSEPYGTVRIVCIDKWGHCKEDVIPQFTKVLISSALGQSILVKKITSKRIRLTLFGDSEPVVDAKQHDNKLRYVVTNSGPIEKIRVDGSFVYNVADRGRPIMTSPFPNTIVYTCVTIS